MLGKDPNRRKSRSGSRAQASRAGARGRAERSSSRPSTGTRSRTASPEETFVLYVEGPRDREILECWARRVDPRLARCIERNTVILGGRRPARALTDFENRGGTAAGYSGLIVLDGDDLPHPDETENTSTAIVPSSARDERGLEVFVWSLRHIESYLLVPAAIRRMLRLGARDRRIEQFIETYSSQSGSLPNSNAPNISSSVKEPSSPMAATRTGGSLHAKRVLGTGGSLSKALGSELHAGEIARAMRVEDLHQDVLTLFTRMSSLSGLAIEGPEVVIRSS